MTVRFRYRVEPDPRADTRVFALVGSLDSGKLIEELANELQAQASRYLLLDFSGISYINSTGFGAVVVLVSELREAGKEVYITDPSEKARIVLDQLAKDLLPVYPRQDALTRIRDAAP